MTFWPPESGRIKLAIVFVFAVLGITAIWLQQQKENRDKVQSSATNAELVNWQRGDSTKPPRLGHPLISVNPDNGITTIRFTVENDSDFPAYDINGRVWDLENVPDRPAGLEDLLRHDIAHFNIPSLSSRLVQLIGNIDVPAEVKTKRFGAQYNCRVGGFGENIKAQRVNGNWLFALQVRTFDAAGRIVFKQIDPGFPLNEHGDIDW